MGEVNEMAGKTMRDEHFAEAGWTVRDGECPYETGLLVSCCSLLHGAGSWEVIGHGTQPEG